MRSLVLAVLLCAVCAAPASALVGGTPTTRNLPHMVAMEFRDSPTASEWSFRCGGSLVAPDVVLTAAHCVSGDESVGEPDTFAAAQFRFLAGTKVRSSGGERIVAAEVVEHPSYDGDDAGGYDVALVRLERASTLGAPIALAGPGDYPAGKEAIVTGWGANAFQVGMTSDQLEEIVVPIRSDAECGSTSIFSFSPDTMLCAGDTLGGKDSCQGDSGGPLMVAGAGGALVLAGDVSFGFGCAFPTQYGVYGEIAGGAMRPFVEQGIASLSRAGGAAPSPSSGGGGPTTGTATPTRRRVSLPATVRRSLRVRVAANERLRRVRVRLVQRGRTVASAGTRTLRGAKTLRLKRRGAVRLGRATLRLRARDAAGRTVSAQRRVRVRR